jgi:hypothetical protein
MTLRLKTFDFPHTFGTCWRPAAGLKTVGEIRETADERLPSFQDFGPSSVAHLRKTLGLPSTDGVRPHQGAAAATSAHIKIDCRLSPVRVMSLRKRW